MSRHLPSLIDPSNPESLANLVDGDAFRDAVSRVPADHFALGEDELRERAKPTRTDLALRSALWNEIRLNQDTGAKIQPARLHKGICSVQHYYANVLKDPFKVAWMLSPARSYEEELKAIVQIIPARLYDIVAMDWRDAKGQPVPALMKISLQAMTMVQDRIYGAPTQRLESKVASFHVEGSLPLENRTSQTMEELDKELALLEEQMSKDPSNAPREIVVQAIAIPGVPNDIV